MVKRNKILIIAAGLVLLAIIIISYFVYIYGNQGKQLTDSSPTPISSNTSGFGNSQPTAIIPSATPIVLLFDPYQVVTSFYSWYISYKGNPLRKGAYYSSPYLTSKYKKLISEMYGQNKKLDPLICKENKKFNVVIENPVYNSTSDQAQVNIDEINTNIILQEVQLEKINGDWLIYDIDCMPQD